MEECEDHRVSRSLVKAIANGDIKAEEQFIERYREGVLIMLLGMTKDRARAEDLTHEALIVVLKRMRSNEIKEPHKLSCFLFQTAKFCYFGWLRRRDNQAELWEQFNDVPSSFIDAQDKYENHEREEILYDSIASLAVPRDREILFRRYVRDQSKSEICDALLLSVDCYNRVISRARLRLKENIERSDKLALG